MKKKIGFIFVFGVFFYGSSFGHAYAKDFAALQYSNATYSEDGFADVKPSAMVLRFGRAVDSGVTLEGRVGLGLSSDEILISNVPVSFEIDRLLGLYGVGYADLGQRSSVYGVLGYSIVDVTISGGGISISDDESDVSFGVGINIGLDNNSAINIEYMQYFSNSDSNLDALSFGVVFKF